MSIYRTVCELEIKVFYISFPSKNIYKNKSKLLLELKRDFFVTSNMLFQTQVKYFTTLRYYSAENDQRKWLSNYLGQWGYIPTEIQVYSILYLTNMYADPSNR